MGGNGLGISNDGVELDLNNLEIKAPNEGFTFLVPSPDPVEDLEKLAMPHQKANLLKRIWGGDGFQHFMAEMPLIDPRQPDQTAQVNATRIVLEKIREKVLEDIASGALPIPEVPDGEMGRIILGVEKPTEIDGQIIPGAEVVLALWGKGNTAPVHGHAPGLMHEAMISGNIDIHTFEPEGDLQNREARYAGTISQKEPGIFYSNYRRDVGQEGRMEVIHSFRATEFTITLHYLPEHVRDSNGNGVKVVNTAESIAQIPEYINKQPFRPGFDLSASDVTEVSKAEIIENYKIGDVYLVRSQNVPFLGDHFAMITGDLEQKPHGLRPADMSFPIPHGETTLLDNYQGQHELIALKLNDEALRRFYDHYDVPQEIRR